tara:strand:- start:104088 stop:105605 length:1518 start_codon:yes stop_codon:yes gene_type:complete
VQNFIKSQEELLGKILSSINKTALFKHYNLQHILSEQDFKIQYDEFVEQVPIGNMLSYLNTLRAITGDIRAKDVDVLSYPKIVNNKSTYRIALHGNDVFPASKEMLTASFMLEEMLQNGQISGLEKVKGKIFHVYDDIKLGYKSELIVGSFHTIRQSTMPRKLRKILEPQLDTFQAVGNSRYQKLHAFLQSMETLSSKIEVLIVRPHILSEMALLLAQREGRYVTLKEICPNIKIIVYYGENMGPYKQSILSFLDGLNCKRMEIMAHPSGILAYQNNIYERNLLTLSDREGVFYEFIPKEDLKPDGSLKRHFRRRYAGNIKIGQEYVLAISNASGLLGFNSEIVVKVESIEPFVVNYCGHTDSLDYFGERINPHELETLIESMNSTLTNYNFHIREYLIGDHLEQERSYWLFELNVDLQTIKKEYLQSAANSIHNEMSLQNPHYRQAIMNSAMSLPEMYFVPMGSISNTITDINVLHVDFDEEVHTILNILKYIKDFVKVTPVLL